MPPASENPRAASDLLEEVRDAARALAELAEQGGMLWPRMSAALRATCDDVQRRLTSNELAILVVGPADGGKRTLINTAVGAAIMRSEAREPRAVVRVRHGDEPHYVCELCEGGTRSLDSAFVAKTRTLGESLSRAERELVDAEGELRDLRRRLGELREAVPFAPPSVRETAKSLWQRLVAWIVALVRRPRRLTGERTVALQVAEPVENAPLSKDERFARILALERALLDAEPRFAKATDALERARTEAREHAAERARIVLDESRALTDADAGAEIVELAIDYPSALLPPGLVLVDAPQLFHSDRTERDAAWTRLRDDLGGCIVVSPGGRKNVLAPDLLARLDPIAPHGVRGLVHGLDSHADADAELSARLRGELPALFARIREESATVVAAFVTRVVRDRLATLTRACAATTTEIEAQIAELERRRPPSAAEFRARTLGSIGPTTEDAARRLLQNARETLHARIVALGDEWEVEFMASVDRASVEACIERVNASASTRFRTLCDDLAMQIANDVQSAGAALQARLRDELSVAYRTRSSETDPSCVNVSIHAGLPDAADVPPVVDDVPLAATRDAFEQKRVGIGLGGAAAGAAIGTLILPGVGTAVGAMVGVLAGLVEGTGALKRQAIERVRAHGALVESEISARLESAAPSVARDLAASFGEALERALAARQQAIARFCEEADRTLARERQKLEELARVRRSLAAHEDRFAKVAHRAGSALQARAATRGGGPELRFLGSG